MSDSVYILYYNNDLVGIIQDSESFWHLYEWLSDSPCVCNVVTMSKSDVDIPADLENFNKLMSIHGETILSKSTMSIDFQFDENKI